MTKDGGQSQLALYVDGVRQGESWTASADNDAWQSKTVADVTIDAGDEITIEVRGNSREGDPKRNVSRLGRAPTGERGPVGTRTQAARLDYVQLHHRAQVSGNNPDDTAMHR